MSLINGYKYTISFADAARAGQVHSMVNEGVFHDATINGSEIEIITNLASPNDVAAKLIATGIDLLGTTIVPVQDMREFTL